jgi:hypothetical protein
VAEFGKSTEKSLLLPASYRNSPARLRVSGSGLFDYVNVWSPIAREVSRFFRLLFIRSGNGKIRIIDTTTSRFSGSSLERGAAAAYAENGQLIAAGRLAQRHDVGFFLGIGGQRISIGGEFAAVIGGLRDFELFYRPASPALVPVQLVIGSYSSQNPWDTKRHFIPRFSLTIQSFEGRTDAYKTIELRTLPSPASDVGHRGDHSLHENA